MGKRSEELKELQRLINRIAPLEGVCVSLPPERFVVFIEGIQDPEPILNALQEIHHKERTEAEALSILQRAFSVRDTPRRVTSSWLATAQRDIRRLESPGLLEVVQANPKLFKGREVNASWLRSLRERLSTLTSQEARGGVWGLLSAMLRPEQVGWLWDVHGALVEQHSAQPQRASRRLELVALRLSGQASLQEEAEYDSLIESYAAQASEAQRLPGRSRRRRLWQLAAALYAWPEKASHTFDDEALPSVSEDLSTAICEMAAVLRRSYRGASTSEYARRSEYTLACYALLAPPEEKISLTSAQLVRLQRRWRLIKGSVRELRLSFAQLTQLAYVEYETERGYPSMEDRLHLIGQWLAEGISWSELASVSARTLLDGMLEHQWSARVARSYCRWVLELAPHYEQQGVSLAITAESFQHMQQAKSEELALLARCLLEQAEQGSQVAAREQIARLDTMLSLFQKVPQHLKDCLQGLDEIPEGIGVKLFPEFSAWLSDARRLDQYLYYRALLHEEQTLPSALLEDFSRMERRTKERAYLSSLSNPTELQKKMLARLSEEEAPIDPARTRRRLEERCNELLQRIYQSRLDALIAQSFARAYGLNLPKITPAWRDIFRFYLNTDENQRWLGLLLQRATQSPGQYFAPSLPQNQRWLKEAAGHCNVSAWIAPRRVSKGDLYQISLEDDPIEVLRMGVPFDTCLSLEDGSNAASTVLNALDVNKRVVYARSKDGAIVGRQLLAISSSFQLLRYRIYTSVSKEARPVLEEQMRLFVEEIAAHAKLDIASKGQPEKLHDGFWYDDGVLSVDGGLLTAEVQRYCESLGLSAPKNPPESLVDVATGWLAMQEERVEDVVASLGWWQSSYGARLLGRWLYQRLGYAECARRVLAGEEKLLPVMFRVTSQEGLKALLSCVRHIGRGATASEPLYQELMERSISAGDLIPIAKEANLLAARSEKMNDHGIEHGLLYEVHRHIPKLSLRDLFLLADELQPICDWILLQQSECADCVESAMYRIKEESARAYLNDPDKKLVISCLQDKGRSRLSRLIALRLVALFPMPKRGEAKISITNWFEREVCDEVSTRNMLRDLARDTSFAREPDLLAAMLRQGASLEEIEQLPRLAASPLKSLDNLISQIDWLGAWVRQHFIAPDCEPQDWRPDLWELFFHRRLSTLWRKALRAAASIAQRATNLLMEIGDTESLTRLQREGHARTKRQEAEQSLILEEIRWQLDPAHKSFSDFNKGWSYNRRAPIDAVLVRAALRLLHETKEINEEISPKNDVSRALMIVFLAEIPLWIKIGVVEKFSAKKAPWPLAVMLRDCNVESFRMYYSMSPSLILRLWEHKILQAPIVEDLVKMFHPAEHKHYLNRMKDAAKELSLSADSFIERWVAQIAASGNMDELRLWEDRARQQEIARILLKHCAPSVWLRVYRELPDATSAAWFLEIVKETKDLASDEILALLTPPDENDNEDRVMREGWLRDALTKNARD